MVNQKEIKIHLRCLEERLVNPTTRCSSDELNLLIADDFLEYGSSGKIYNKKQVISSLVKEEAKNISISDFKIKFLSPEVALLTYKTVIKNNFNKEKSASLRSSIWKNTDESWRIIFHQGTPLNYNPK